MYIKDLVILLTYLYYILIYITNLFRLLIYLDYSLISMNDLLL